MIKKKIIKIGLTIFLLNLLIISNVNALVFEKSLFQKENEVIKLQNSYDYFIKWDDEKDIFSSNKVTTDNNQNVIIVGDYDDRAFIVKYDKDGNELWNNTIKPEYLNLLPVEQLENNEPLKFEEFQCETSKNLDETNLNQLQRIFEPLNILNMEETDEMTTFLDVAVAPDDSIVAVGSNLVINNTDPFNSNANIYVVKFSPNGDVDWNKLYSVQLIDWGMAVDIAANGNIYVACNSIKFFDFGGHKAFFIKIKPSGIRTGTFFYTIDFPPGWSNPLIPLMDIAVNPNSGHIWLAGAIADVGGGQDGDTDQDIYVVEFGPFGVIYEEWQYDSGTSDYVGMFDNVYAMAIDEYDNIILAGLRAIQLTNKDPDNDTEIELDDMRNFLVKLNSNGESLLDNMEDYNCPDEQSMNYIIRNGFREVKLRKDEAGNSKEIVAHTCSKSDSFYTVLYNIDTGSCRLKVEEGDLGDFGTTYGMAVNVDGNVVVTGNNGAIYGSRTYTMYYVIEENLNQYYRLKQKICVPPNPYSIIYVDDDAPPGGDGSYQHPFQKIQDAINASEEGDKIYVFNGNYTEDIQIPKSISLYGQDKESTIIRGNGEIKETYEVKITGFTITTKEIGNHILLYIIESNNCEFYDNNFYILHNGSHNRYSVCFWLNGSSNNIIRNNYFEGLRDFEYDLFTTHAIGLFFDSNENTISNNTFIDLNSACQLNDYSNFNTVSNNLAENNALTFWISFGKKNIISENEMYDSGGIVLLLTTGNIISKNTINNGSDGIFLILQANNNEIIANNIIGHSFYGINITNCFNNHIYHNNLIGNGYGYTEGAQAEDYLGVNFWYKSIGFFRGAGNYWDDYEGFDILPPYGIGDIPYRIKPQTKINKDRFPFMKPIDIKNITINCKDFTNDIKIKENLELIKEELYKEILTRATFPYLLNNHELNQFYFSNTLEYIKNNS